MFNKVTLHSA